MTFSPQKLNTKTFLHFVPNIFENYLKIFTLDKMKDMKVLDIGTGPGHILLDKIVPILPKNYSKILATDKSTDMVEFFNTLPKDERITSRLLDIEEKKLPKDLNQKFDFLFSSYCFQYIGNFTNTFNNSSKMLKQNGELFFIWSKRSHLLEAYQTLSQTKKWENYTKDFKNWKTHFDCEKPLDLLKYELDKVGLKILKNEHLANVHLYGKEVQELYNIVDVLDFVSERIPSYDLEEYKKEFRKLTLSDVVGIDEDENGYKFKILLESIAVGAKKI